MTTLTANEEYSINEFMKSIDSVSLIMRTSSSLVYRVFKVYVTSFFIIAENSKSLKILKSMAESCNPCDKACSPKECAVKVLEISKKVRDDIAVISDDFKTVSILTPLAVAFDNILTEWDDFVVDLTISSDPDVGNAIGQLINAL
nr:hypothetical protein [uncultured Desulfobacter sp.]